MKVYFVSTNSQKIEEARSYVEHLKRESGLDVELGIIEEDVAEILHSDIDVIVRSKALAAFSATGLPCTVEHSGLYMEALPGLPGGIGKIIWDAVGDRMCDFLHEGDSREATAVSVIGYCDGRRIHTYRGETRGQVAPKARGKYLYNWDPIFIPEGGAETYGEMGAEKKRATSPTAKAWDAFFGEHFQTGPRQPKRP
jgi:XTP/dITP diphosphohydrolase